MAVFSRGGVTSPDLYIGIFCILTVLLCTFLNTVVFWHNYKKKRSLPRTLYLILAAADLATSWVLLMVYSVYILEKCSSEEDVHCGREGYYAQVQDTSTAMNLYTTLSWTMSLTPAHITAFLAVTRFLQIRYPLRLLNVKYWVCGLVASIVWIPVVVGSAVLITGGNGRCSYPSRINILYTAWIYCPRVFGIRLDGQMYYVMITSLTAFLQLAAISVSVFTIWELVKVHLNPVSGGPRRERGTKSSVKIILTNLGSLIALILISVAGRLSGTHQSGDTISFGVALFFLMISTIAPPLLSTLNPIIYIILTPKCTFKFFFPFECKRQSKGLNKPNPLHPISTIG